MSRQVGETLQEMLDILKEGRMTEGRRPTLRMMLSHKKAINRPSWANKLLLKDWTNSERRSVWRRLSAM
jgi:hypothetical protein